MSTQDMIEQIARHLCEADGYDPDILGGTGNPRWWLYATTAGQVVPLLAEAWSLGVGVALYCGPHDIPPNPYKQAANHQKEETMEQTQENMKVINRVRFIDIGGHMINIAHISHIEPYENWNPEKPGTTLGDPGTRIWMNNGRDLIFHDLTIDRFCDIITSQLAAAE